MLSESELLSKRDEIKAVLSATDILDIVGRHTKLKKVGSRYVGLCPFHAEKTPSFSVHPGRGFFHCFGCQASGDAFSFLMKMEGKTFPEAIEELAARAGIELPGSSIGHATNSPMFTSRAELYGLDQSLDAIKRTGRAVLALGCLDAIELTSAGVEGVVAGCCTPTITEGQAQLLRRFCDRAISVYDGDEAGQEATLRAAEILLRQDVAPYAVILPAGYNPRTYILSHGPEAINRLVDEAHPTIEVFADRGMWLPYMIPMLAAIQDQVRLGACVRWLSERYRVDEEKIIEDVAYAKNGYETPKKGR